MNRREVIAAIAALGLSKHVIVRAQTHDSGETKWATSKDGTRIAYEVIGDGPSLVLQHGATRNRHRWKTTGYVEALRDQYQLILVDARGHGESDEPLDPAAYSHARIAEDVAAVVELECDEPASMWGYSMGGRITFACMAYTPSLFSRFIIGGHASSLLGLDEEGVQRRTARAERLKEQNLLALAAYMRNSMVFDDTFRDRLRGFSGPSLIYLGSGDADRMRAQGVTTAEYLSYIAEPTYVELEGLNHLEAFERSDLVLPHVLQFLEQT